MKYLALLITSIVITIACCLWLNAGREIKSRTVRTMHLMQNIYLDIVLLNPLDSNRLAIILQSSTNLLSANQNVATFLKGCKDPEVTNSVKLISYDGLFHDGWGVPLFLLHQLSMEIPL
jgi:hypothetical protein